MKNTQLKTENKFNLGSKNVKKTFFSIFIPTLIAQLIAGTFIIFDTFFVSHGFQASGIFGGDIGNLTVPSSSYASLGSAAISYAVPYTFFIIGIGLAIGGGLSAIMTKQIAVGDKISAQRTMNSFTPLVIIGGIILMVILLIFAKVLIWFGSGFQKDYLSSWFNNPMLNSDWSINETEITNASYNMINGHILSQASWYLRIQALGAIPYIYMSAGVVMLRVQGKAQYATSFSAVGLIINIVLDFIFIMILKMNVVGAAIATVIGQYVTAFVYWYYFKHRAEIKSTTLDWNNSKIIVKEVFVGGVSIMMLQVITGMILIMFTFSIGITNYGDMSLVTNYTAVYQGYNAVFIFSNLMIIAVAQSMKPIVQFNFIKGNIENVKKARTLGYSIGMTFSLIITMFVVVFSNQIIGAFYLVNGSSIDFIVTGSQNGNGTLPSIYTNGMKVAGLITSILFISFPIAALIQLTSTYIQAIGQDKRTSVVLFGKLILLFPLILIFGFGIPWAITGEWIYTFVDGSKPNLNTTANLGMFLSLPVTDFIIGLISIYFLFDSEKKVIKSKTSL
ncbi:MAG: polysaccharide biosynthesis C-terminal domain-containing protein [Mycoplasmataceae bacterium]|nr:polysaccharide biosynthesis C-terminal domain-containing protein [Mycoplasmataceae bacterium]